jgi:murein DD-endopeptidase MepM/ murein hydrolase activator NlpD
LRALLLSLLLVAGCFRAASPPRTARSSAERPSELFKAPLKTYTVLSRFGPRGRRFHTGIDIRGQRGGGDPVYAARAGKVLSAKTERGYGKAVVILHPDGFRTRYAHLRKYNVKAGQKVNHNSVVGIVGATGRATTAHLHFEILTPSNRFVDPAPLMIKR